MAAAISRGVDAQCNNARIVIYRVRIKMSGAGHKCSCKPKSRGEEIFASWLTGRNTHFFRFTDGIDFSLSGAKLPGRKVHRPDFFICPGFFSIAVDVKYYDVNIWLYEEEDTNFTHDVLTVDIMLKDIQELWNFEKVSGVPCWICIVPRKQDAPSKKMFHFARVEELFHFFSPLSRFSKALNALDEYKSEHGIIPDHLDNKPIISAFDTRRKRDNNLAIEAERDHEARIKMKDWYGKKEETISFVINPGPFYEYLQKDYPHTYFIAMDGQSGISELLKTWRINTEDRYAPAPLYMKNRALELAKQAKINLREGNIKTFYDCAKNMEILSAILFQKTNN
jgi:hypothetical protein